MARGKKHTAEQIVNLLRQVEVGVANGKTLPQVCKEVEIVEQTYYRWRKELGGLKGGPGSTAKGTGAGEREAETVGFGVEPGEAGVEGHRLGKLLSPERRRCANMPACPSEQSCDPTIAVATILTGQRYDGLGKRIFVLALCVGR
jgi:putative transposase